MDDSTVQAVLISDSALKARVAPVTALLTAWKTTLLNTVSFAMSALLLVLGYLQTVNIGNIVTPTQAMLWIMAVNIAQILLRAYGVKPIVLDTAQGAAQGGAQGAA